MKPLPLRPTLLRATALAVLWTAGTVVPAAGQGIPVTVGVGALASGAGQFDLPVRLDMSARTEKLGSFVVTIRWNPAKLQYVGGQDGDFGPVVANTDSLPFGIAILSGANPAGASGLITLALGRFQVLVNDTTMFRVTVQELYAAGTFANLTSAAVPIDQLFCGALAGRYGDLTRDGNVNAADALVLLTESVGLDVSQYALAFGDVDGNGLRNPRDALIILSFAVGINTGAFRVGQVVSGTACVAPPAQSYGITPSAVQALVGQTVQYYGFGVDASGSALALRNVTYASSNTAVATVGAAGEALAAGAGATTISALEDGTTIASTTLTVVAGRTTHWVDGTAAQARNQLGTTALPFGTLAQAVLAAAAGDTIRVRSGRYAGAVIPRSLTIIGDTSAGGKRPVFVPATLLTSQDTVLTITAGARRVELRDLQVDTADYGIVAIGADTLELRGVDVRGSAGGLAAVRADNGKLVRLTRVGLFGIPNLPYGTSTRGLWAQAVTTVVVDTSVASDFAGSGLYAYQPDSIAVRGSVLRFNGNAGLEIATSDTSKAAKLVFSGNRVTQNAYYGVYGYYVRRAVFDHNAFVGGGYYGDGISLTGNRAALLSILADTLDVRGSQWMTANVFDSIGVDSLVTTSTDYGAQIYDVRRVAITNSTLSAGYYEAFYVTGRGKDTTTVVMRTTTIQGFANLGYYDGYGISTSSATLDIRDSQFSDLYYAVEASYGAVDISRTTFDRTYYAVYDWCATGASRVDSSRIRDTYYGVYAYGCGAAVQPSIVVDSLDVTGSQYGAYLQQLSKGRIRRSRFGQMAYAAYFYVVDSAVVDTSTFSPYYQAVETDYDTVTILNGNTIACGSGTAISVYGGGRAIVRDNLVTGACSNRAIDLQATDSSVIRGNTVNGSGSIGLYGYLNKAQSSLHVVGNTLTGPFNSGSIQVNANDGLAALLRVDSNTVTAGVEAGIYSPNGDSLLIRDNTVTGVKSATCCLSYDGGIVIGNGSSARKWAQVLRNRVVGATYGIRIDRSSPDTLVRVVVDTNRIVGSDSVGLYVTGYSRVLARNNLVDSTVADGIRVDRFVAGDTNVRLTSNNITRSKAYGVRSVDAGLIDARQNWWGDPAGPGGTAGAPGGSTGDSVSSGVDWVPALTSPALVLPPAPPASLMATGTSVAPATRLASRTTLPALREPRQPPDAVAPPSPGATTSAVPLDWNARAAAQRARQEERIRRYRAEEERRAALEAERQARRQEGGR